MNLALSTLAAIAIGTCAFAQSTEAPNSETFSETKQISNAISGELKLDTSLDIIDEVKRHIDDVQRLGEKVDTGEASVDEVASELERLASRFEQIADRAPEVMEKRKELLSDFEALSDELALDREALQAEVAELDKKLSDAKQKLSGLTGKEKAVQKIEVNRLSTLLRHSERKLEIWRRYSALHEDLLPEFNRQSGHMDTFFRALDANADVVRSAADIMRLEASAERAFDEMNAMLGLEELASDLVNSWADIESILDEMVGLGFGS